MKIGKFALPAKPMTRNVAGCACATAAAANATMASQWAMKTAGYDTPMLRALALLFFSVAAAAANRDVYLYQGADREARLIAGAKQEGQVVLYSTMTVQDGRALAAAFEKKYGVKLLHWRGSAEKIVQRAMNEFVAVVAWHEDAVEARGFHEHLPRIDSVIGKQVELFSRELFGTTLHNVRRFGDIRDPF